MESQYIERTDWQYLEMGLKWLNFHWNEREEGKEKRDGPCVTFAKNEIRVISRYKEMVKIHGKDEVDEFIKPIITHRELLEVFCPPQKRCGACRGTKFWKRYDGGEVCEDCHPCPSDSLRFKH